MATLRDLDYSPEMTKFGKALRETEDLNLFDKGKKNMKTVEFGIDRSIKSNR